jgi:hypothetical protein
MQGSIRLASFTFLAATLFACGGSSKHDDKGVVDESEPPAVPFAGGKADGSEKLVALNVQSPHPYTNNLDRVFDVSLATLPSCAKAARLHFRVLRTEADFDYVTVEAAGAPSQSFDGTHDDTWTEWFPATSVKVRLETDGSITRHGFEIDQVEWDGLPDDCPLVRFPPCADDAVDLAKRPGTCECPAAPQCAPLAEVEVRLQTVQGFSNHQKRAVGAIAIETHPGPADGAVTTEVGTVDLSRLRALVRRAAEIGLLATGGYTMPVPSSTRRDIFQIKAGAFDVTFVAPQGGHSAEVQSLITELEALFDCGSGGLTCGSDFTCQEGACVEDQGCFCPAVFDPVCGSNGKTYSNGCAAACANIDVSHIGECGIAGDPCGTLFGFGCQDERRCRYDVSTFEAPFPDAGGTCVEASYCDAPADCNHLAHPAVPGAWACTSNACGWQAGLVWKQLVNGRFETAHPYANSTSVWKETYLPSEAQALRLNASSFRLEPGYDFLEVWTFTNGAWVRVARYTGSAGPRATDEFPGRFHYLRFVSDSSITDQGFRVDAEWR